MIEGEIIKKKLIKKREKSHLFCNEKIPLIIETCYEKCSNSTFNLFLLMTLSICTIVYLQNKTQNTTEPVCYTLFVTTFGHEKMRRVQNYVIMCKIMPRDNIVYM